MLKKDIRYSHNFKQPVFPHQGLPTETIVKKAKRKAEEKFINFDEGEEAKSEEIDTSQPQRKRNIKRKIKKMESELKDKEEKAGNPKVEKDPVIDISPIAAAEPSEEITQQPKVEEAKADEEVKDEVKDDAKEELPVPKPETPQKDDIISGLMRGSPSSHSGGFPDFGDSDNKDKNSN